MEELLGELEKRLEGVVQTDARTRTKYSFDASVFELRPEAIIYPKNSRDIQKIVRFVTDFKHLYPSLSLTPRGAGTDMSGGPLGTSLILDVSKTLTKFSLRNDNLLQAQPGAFIRDIDPVMDKKKLFLGSVPASRSLITIGGMVSNNAGGEQSLRYGNAQRWVREVKAVLADGKEYTLRPLKRSELNKKMAQKDFEGEIYRRIFELVETHYDVIKNARPHTSKNSTGYNLWDVWDREKGIFDLTQLFSGSQGTLGIITDLIVEPIKLQPHTRLAIAYLPSVKKLDTIIPRILKEQPATFEGFDDLTFSLGIKYFSHFRKKLGTKEWVKQQAALLKQVSSLKKRSPKIILMIEFDGDTAEEVNNKVVKLHQLLKKIDPKIKIEIEGTEDMSDAFWNIRRASFTLLRQKIKDRYASPFIDDLTVNPKYLKSFLPEVRRVIKKHKLPATIAGHFGDGNFHIVPLIDIGNKNVQSSLESAMRDLVPIVKKYRGSLAGEHNDGMIRGPWLRAMYGEEIFQLFKQTKEIFDPLYIFNPHKKTDASWDFVTSHYRSK